jgi:hypothetical protein
MLLVEVIIRLLAMIKVLVLIFLLDAMQSALGLDIKFLVSSFLLCDSSNCSPFGTWLLQSRVFFINK